MADPVEVSPGTWLARIFINRHPTTGALIRHRADRRFEADGVRRARVVARQKEAEVRAELAAAHLARTPTVAQAAESWWDLWARRDKSPTTRKGYRSIIDLHIAHAPFAKRLVTDVNTGDIERWYSTLELAPSTVRRVHAVLTQVLRQTVRDGLLARNPAEDAYKPETRPKGKALVPVGTINLLLAAAARRAPIRAEALAFAALTGLRRGEMCGVRHSVVDLDDDSGGGILTVSNNVVVARPEHVGRSAQPVTRGLATKGPKAHQVAAIALGVQAATIARRRIAEQSGWDGPCSRCGHPETEHTAAGSACYRYGCTCDRWIKPGSPTTRGGDPYLWSVEAPYDVPLHPDTLTNWFTQAAKDAGVRGVTLHDLRHWQGSQVLEVGGTVQDAKERLRHKSLATTMGYLHADYSKQRVLVDLQPPLELGGGES